MSHFFEQLDHMLEEAEWASILIVILIALLIISFIVVNIVSCVCQISMKKSLKKLADREPETKKVKE